MLFVWPSAVIILCLSLVVSAAPSIPPPTSHESVPDAQRWNHLSSIDPQPVRGKLGATIIGPQNADISGQNEDLLAPPTTDHGQMPNLKWSFSLSHNRLTTGGWARQQNSVNMRLKAGAIRAEDQNRTYFRQGDARISTMTPEGEIFVGDVSEGDVWYLPAGHPHSIQAKNTTEDGTEFLLIFDSGDFSEDSTFLLTDWLAHVPRAVLAKNFGVSDLTVFNHIPKKELYIFPSSPPPDDPTLDMVVPNNAPNPYTFPLSRAEAKKTSGGSVKVIDSRSFKVTDKISAAEVVVDIGGMRELHWHPTQPEWTFFISGEARMTIFASSSNAQTYNFQAGDIGYIPPSYGHYVENTGSTPLKFLEIFQGGIVQDISLTQWLALTPPALVKAHLGLPDDMIDKLSKVKQEVV
ncbi:hypothetical protein H0H92_015882 [Tricholoma furcatifolium]|nr:hypothetical protein H0H92_015882 [Tricholoma furcatifolium]